MKDIQSQPDHRRINIKKVGVKNISYPITLLDKSRKIQKTVATVNMYVNLPHHFKGTHMSRFIEILNHFHGKINLKSFHIILKAMKNRLQAEEAHMEINFPYFLNKNNKDSTIGIDRYNCKMHGSLHKEDDLILSVEVPIAPPFLVPANYSLPLSLGHWGSAIINLRFHHFIWIEDIIQMVEAITIRNLSWPETTSKNDAENYLSVEKITKTLAQKLAEHPAIVWFFLRVENLSTGFSTFATIEWKAGNS